MRCVVDKEANGPRNRDSVATALVTIRDKGDKGDALEFLRRAAAEPNLAKRPTDTSPLLDSFSPIPSQPIAQIKKNCGHGIIFCQELADGTAAHITTTILGRGGYEVKHAMQMPYKLRVTPNLAKRPTDTSPLLDSFSPIPSQPIAQIKKNCGHGIIFCQELADGTAAHITTTILGRGGYEVKHAMQMPYKLRVTPNLAKRPTDTSPLLDSFSPIPSQPIAQIKKNCGHGIILCQSSM